MTTPYVPGTEEQDPKKVIQSLQNIAGFFDDGTWTPTLTFATPGDLAVAYSLRDAKWTRIRNFVSISFVMITSTFTHTTASGQLLITGLPTNPNLTPVPTNANFRSYAPVLYSGITKAGYASVSSALVGNSSTIQVLASGSGVAVDVVTAANMPTGGTVALGGACNYVIA